MDKEVLREWAKDNKGKTVALGIAIFYLIFALVLGGAGLLLKVSAFLALPLACIFFSDAMGEYTGPSGIGARPFITKTTPGFFVALVGWALLLTPLVMGVLSALFFKGLYSE